MDQKKEDSLNKRYFYKLSTSLVALPIGLITQAIIPRSLGPVAYGQFSFLTNVFAQIVGFLEAGTSIAYFTKLSQNIKDKGIIRFYFGFLFILTILLIGFTSVVIILSFQESVWPGQKRRFIFMALVFSIFTVLLNSLSKTVDAFGLTVKGELISISQKVLALCIILFLFFFWKINLTIFFVYNYIIISFLLVGWIFVLNKGGINIFKIPSLSRIQIRKYSLGFWHYSNPLILYSFIGLVVGFLDLWILQKFAGSTQQGYYGLAYKIAAVAFLFSQAMTPLITREFSVSFGNKDFIRMGLLFKKYIPLLYALAALLAVFLSVEASKVSVLFGGSKFKDASMALSIMALYPIHQTYGQLSGSVFYATGQTSLYRNIGGFVMTGGLILSYFLLAPVSLFGLDLGAVGLAIKMVTVQFIGVNIQLYYNSRYLSMNFLKLFLNQIIVVGIFLLIAGFTNYISNAITSINILSFLISGVLYVFLCLVILYMFPNIILTSKEEVSQYKNKLFALIRKKQ
jgi:O-antigen/teichoic acid export membrane protein